MKNDRFFLWILIGIGVVVVFSVVFVLMNQKEQAYLPDDTPEGVVNNYLLAWYLEDYEKIADYLVEDENKPGFQMILNTAINNQYSMDSYGVQIEESIIHGSEASVVLTLIDSPTGPFRDSYQQNNIAALVEQDGHWKIKEFPYPYWGWDWYQAPASYQK